MEYSANFNFAIIWKKCIAQTVLKNHSGFELTQIASNCYTP